MRTRVQSEGSGKRRFASDRLAIARILQLHGYSQITADRSVVRVKGEGRFGEHVAVHPEKKVYTLWIRRGGQGNLRGIAFELGGNFRGPALGFEGLDLAGLDRTLSHVQECLLRQKQ
jgi:hypothetical protein